MKPAQSFKQRWNSLECSLRWTPSLSTPTDGPLLGLYCLTTPRPQVRGVHTAAGRRGAWAVCREVACLVLGMPGVCEHAQTDHHCKLRCSSKVQVLHLRVWGAICTDIAMVLRTSVRQQQPGRHAAGFRPILGQDRTRSICFSEGITFLHWNICQIKICCKLSDLPTPVLFSDFW